MKCTKFFGVRVDEHFGAENITADRNHLLWMALWQNLLKTSSAEVKLVFAATCISEMAATDPKIRRAIGGAQSNARLLTMKQSLNRGASLIVQAKNSSSLNAYSQEALGCLL